MEIDVKRSKENGLNVQKEVKQNLQNLVSQEVSRNQQPHTRRNSEERKHDPLSDISNLIMPIILFNELGEEFMVSMSDIPSFVLNEDKYLKKYVKNFEQKASNLYCVMQRTAKFLIKEANNMLAYTAVLERENIGFDEYAHVFTVIDKKLCQFTCKNDNELIYSNLRCIENTMRSINSVKANEEQLKSNKKTHRKIRSVMLKSKGEYKSLRTEKLKVTRNGDNICINCGQFNYLIDLKGEKITLYGEAGGARPANEVEIYGIAEPLIDSKEDIKDALSLLGKKFNEIDAKGIRLSKHGEYITPNYTLRISDYSRELQLKVGFDGYEYDIDCSRFNPYSHVDYSDLKWGAFSVWVGEPGRKTPIRDMNIIEVLGIKKMLRDHLLKDFLHKSHNILRDNFIEQIGQIEDIYKKAVPFKDR